VLGLERHGLDIGTGHNEMVADAPKGRTVTHSTFPRSPETSALATSSFVYKLARFASAIALVGKDLLARRRVWPFRTYHSNEPSAHLYRRTVK
jgi:hypothetical protein